MLIIGTDTLVDFAFAMFCGMRRRRRPAPIYTWKDDPSPVSPYEVVQSPFTKQMMLEARETAETPVSSAKPGK